MKCKIVGLVLTLSLVGSATADAHPTRLWSYRSSICQHTSTLTTSRAACAMKDYALAVDGSDAIVNGCRRVAGTVQCSVREYGSCWLAPGGKCGGWNETIGMPNCGLSTSSPTWCGWSVPLRDVTAKLRRARIYVSVPFFGTRTYSEHL